MSTPAVAFTRFACACLLGCLLGVYYGFLRPLRPKALGDLLFLLGLGWVFLYLGFGICQGDFRFGYTAGLFLGIILWLQTGADALQPIFNLFWNGFFRFFAAILCLFAKIFKKLKKS